ncbi:hypothetical protein M569_05762, partial [Genlisea aurea]
KMRSEAASTSGDGFAVESVVVDFGHRRSSCGYCKSGSRTSISHGLWAHSLTVDAYQGLLDRGWRRSGCFLYKPDMEKTCCPSYTIRLKAADFVPSKDQNRVYKRMERYLDGRLDVKRTSRSKDVPMTSDELCVEMGSPICDLGPKEKPEQIICLLSDQISMAGHLYLKRWDSNNSIQLPKAAVKKVEPAKRKLQALESEELVLSCNAAFQIGAALRRLKKEVDHSEAAKLNSVNEKSPETIAEFLASHLKDLAESYGLSVRACNGHLNYYSPKNHVKAEVETSAISTKTYAVDQDKHLNKACEGSGSHGCKLEVRIMKSCFDPEEYSLYKKYQVAVHNDTPDVVTKESYKRFLVDTPLIHIPPNSHRATTPPCGFGSFHQQYLIDGKLVAVGVIDILPNCLSSKYLFWDPDVPFLSLGKYAALEEIRWVHENQLHCPSLQYYYLGYYIHSCSKMRYKAAYRPSELLCPLRYRWILYDIAKPLLDRRKYVVLSDY